MYKKLKSIALERESSTINLKKLSNKKKFEHQITEVFNIHSLNANILEQQKPKYLTTDPSDKPQETLINMRE
jgi:hypothetical protein